MALPCCLNSQTLNTAAPANTVPQPARAHPSSHGLRMLAPHPLAPQRPGPLAPPGRLRPPLLPWPAHPGAGRGVRWAREYEASGEQAVLPAWWSRGESSLGP